MASPRTSAKNHGPKVQNNGPWVQNNRPWVKRVLLEREMLDTRSPWLQRRCSALPSDVNGYYVNIVVLTAFESS